MHDKGGSLGSHGREIIDVAVADIVFREDLAGRPENERSSALVERYVDQGLEVLPPIEINQKRELIDGWHRCMAHRKAEASTIKAIVTPTSSDLEVLELAIERNAKHGKQLSQRAKREKGVQLYRLTPLRDRDQARKRLAVMLSVSDRTIRNWLADVDGEARAARHRRIRDLWIACHTQEEIAAAADCTRDEVRAGLQDFGDFGKLSGAARSAASHDSDFEVPIYNVWREGLDKATIVDRLLYAYTEPFDVVVDPFGGSGTTIKVCRKRLRRYWISDGAPAVERAHQIRQHDITAGLPGVPQWQDVRLVFLHPPFDELTGSLPGIITRFAKKLSSGAAIALFSEPVDWRLPDGYDGRACNVFRDISPKLPIDMRIVCPRDRQRCPADDIEWAEQNRECLALSRDIVIWRVP